MAEPFPDGQAQALALASLEVGLVWSLGSGEGSAALGSLVRELALALTLASLPELLGYFLALVVAGRNQCCCVLLRRLVDAGPPPAALELLRSWQPAGRNMHLLVAGHS